MCASATRAIASGELRAKIARSSSVNTLRRRACCRTDLNASSRARPACLRSVISPSGTAPLAPAGLGCGHGRVAPKLGQGSRARGLLCELFSSIHGHREDDRLRALVMIVVRAAMPSIPGILTPMRMATSCHRAAVRHRVRREDDALDFPQRLDESLHIGTAVPKSSQESLSIPPAKGRRGRGPWHVTDATGSSEPERSVRSAPALAQPRSRRGGWPGGGPPPTGSWRRTRWRRS